MTRGVALTVWVVVVAALVGLEVIGIVDDRFPSFVDYLAWLTRSRVGRTLTMLAWLWLGWHLFVRAS